MFTTTCGACGTVARFEESEVPPSGMLTTCAKCGSELSVVPPGMGLFYEATAESTSEPNFDDLIDLPAPKTRPQREELPDLPVPVGPKPRSRDLPDLLAPVGPRPTNRASDLLAPVSTRTRRAPAVPPPTPPQQVPPSANRSTTDLLAPVGPTPTQRNVPDLLTPVGPTGSLKNSTDLLTPVGPHAVRNAPDLLQPVGPYPVRNAPDLLEPVGPYPVRNAPDLLEPVGPVAIRNAPEFPEPVGPRPTKGIDLPAPKGFFDEDPPPAPLHGGDDFDDELEMVPAGEVPDFHPEVEPLRDHSYAGPNPGFSMDDLDLSGAPVAPARADDEAPGYGDVDLPRASDDGLVSFSAPSSRTAAGARPAGLDLAEPIKKKQGTLAGDLPADEAEPTPKARRARRGVPKGVIIAVLALAAIAAGAYYVYTSIELTLFGILTLPAQDRQAQIARGLAETRKLLASSDFGHWGRAGETAEKVVKLDRLQNEAKELAAQAYAARAIEEGRDLKADRDKADALIADVQKMLGRGPEIDKAVALRSILDQGKASDALTTLTKVTTAAPKDGDAALFAGWAALEAKAYDQALAQFQKALEITPDRQPALVGLGRAEVGLGDVAKAKDAFQRAVFDKTAHRQDYAAWLGLTELESPPRDRTGKREKALAVLVETAPERLTAHPKDRARAYKLYGDEAIAAAHWNQASERYRHALELDPRNVDALVGTALAAIEERTHEGGSASLVDARKALEAALVIDPKNVAAKVGLVRIDLIDGRAADAERDVQDALTVGDKNAAVHYWNGKVLEDPIINDMPAAEAAYRRSIELAPNDYAAYVALSQLYLGKARTFEKLLKKADAKAQTDKAVAILAPIAEAAKTDKEMANILGSAYFGAHDMVHAEEWFRVAGKIDPAFIDARINLAAALEAQNKLPEATAVWASAYHDAPRREDIALGLARAYEKGRKFDVAEKIYGGLLSTDGGNVPTARALGAAGLYYARRGQIELAKKQGNAVAAIDPGNPAALFLQGVGLMEDGKTGDATRLFHDAIALDPQAQYWETLARLLYSQKAYTEAKAANEQALKIDSNYAPAIMGLAKFLLAQRAWPQAIPLLQQAQQLDPSAVAIPIGLGDAFTGMGVSKHSDAKVAYQDALRIDPKDGTTHFKLGALYKDDGENTLAEAQLRQAIELGPKDADWYPTAYEKLGYVYRASGNQAAKCATFKLFLEFAKPTDQHLSEIRHDILGCRK